MSETFTTMVHCRMISAMPVGCWDGAIFVSYQKKFCSDVLLVMFALDARIQRTRIEHQVIRYGASRCASYAR